MTRREFTGQLMRAGAVAAVASGTSAAHAAAGTRASVRIHNGVPSLLIRDSPALPYIYFFPYPVKEFIADFAKAGIHIYSWGWGSIIAHCLDLGWIGPNKFDYSEFDEQAKTILEADSDGYLIPRVAVSAPQWWLENHPDDCLRFHDGSVDRPASRSGRPRMWTSLASRVWLDEATDALRRFIRHSRELPFGDRFIGYQITGGDNEWFYVAAHDERRFPDYSPAARSRFREWLGERYGNDTDKLRKAWKDPRAAFETAEIPTREQRLQVDVDLFRDPSVSTKASDFHQFLSDVTADAVVHFSRVVKEATSNDSLAGAFYGYVVNACGGFSGGYSAIHWGHQSLRKVLAAPEIDYLCAPYQYCHRGVGGYDGPQSLEESVRLHGKLYFTECDTPTFIAKGGVQGIPGIPSRSESFAILKRDFAHRLITKQGMWWMDLIRKEGWYHHSDIVRFLRRTTRLLHRSHGLNPHYRAQVAVIFDEETPFYVKPGFELCFPLVYLQDRLGLARMGCPYDMYLHNDLEHPDFPDYRLYIFLNTLYLTSAERQAIIRRVRRNNAVSLWIYAPGIMSETGLSADYMRELTGIQLSFRPATADHNQLLSNRIYLCHFEHPITRDLPSAMFYGTDSPIGPIVFSEDEEALILGRLLPPHALPQSIGEFPGLVLKRTPEWTSVFSAAPNLPSSLLRSIARFAGCHIYSDQDDIVYANSHFLCVHTDRGGTRTIRLPSPTEVYDAFTEHLVARRTSVFTDRFATPDTKLYFLGNISSISDPTTVLSV